MRTLEQAQPSRLKWLQPRTTSAADFSDVRSRLKHLLLQPKGVEVYAQKSRSIYRVEDADLGVIAIKELRYETTKRQIAAAFHKRHRELCEYWVGSGFEARGGKTPAILGAALESGRLGLYRVFIFLRWLDGAVELNEALKSLGDKPKRKLLRQVGLELVRCAKMGLVHGRHSPKNLLVVKHSDPPDIYVIDFAYSQLFESLNLPGFALDVARISFQLSNANLLSEHSRAILFDEIATETWDDSALAERGRDWLEQKFRFMRDSPKTQRHKAVMRNAYLRGLPHRI